jgi:protein-disulfide isomerase
VALWLVATSAGAQTSPADVERLEREIESLRAAQAGMREELQEIRALLQKPGAAAAEAPALLGGMTLSLRNAQTRGAADARIVLVEFSDFQCPFCGRHAKSTYPQILRDYVDTGKVRYAFVNFPIESLHPLAFRQHVAAACAADQQRFWEMHDRLFADQAAAEAPALIAHAAAIGLDVAAFRACLESDRHAGVIRDAMSAGSVIGVSGTPTFVIGIAGPGDDIKAVQLIAGAKPYPVFRNALDGVLATVLPAHAAAGPPRLAVVPSK